ncbi:hypothetical protein [Paenibacillus cineris]|uniref:hypothetical protein n=1 Tax=Paenibacillus cineris TaxID=237530 RepID=UPI001B0B76A4|nr:hypothetical protein [Paenibacillus cineris]GIO63567.1 hypothetical protein J43TS9_51410 [Paenibacillus cineris]
MKLYQVYNGYNGYGPVHVTVIANNEEEAKALASTKLKENGTRYSESYWLNLEVVLLSDDTSVPFVSNIED